MKSFMKRWIQKVKKFKFDIILISVLIIGLVSWLVFWAISGSNVNKKAIVEYNNEEILEIDLNVDQEIRLHELKNGETLKYEMLIVVKKGYIFVKENDCPNHDCIKEGKKNKIGDTIICLPNRILIRIVKA